MDESKSINREEDMKVDFDEDFDLFEKNNEESLSNPDLLEEVKNYSTWEILRRIVKNWVPSTLSMISIFLLETLNIVFIGRLNVTNFIAAIGLGTFYVNATGLIVGWGLLGGIDTLCSQAFGLKRFRIVGNYASIGRLVTIVFFFCFTIPMNFLSYRILKLTGIDEEISQLTTKYCHYMAFTVFFGLQFNASIRYLQAMNVYLPGLIIIIITTAISPLWCYYFIYYLEMNVIGAAISLGISQLLNFISITGYIHIYNPYPDSYVPYLFSKSSFNKLSIFKYLYKAVPAAFLTIADGIGIELLTLMSNFLGAIPLAANVCLLNFIFLVFTIPNGLASTTTTLVGNSVGAGNKHNLLKYSYIGVLLGLLASLIISAFIYIFKDLISSIYTNEPNVNKQLSLLLSIYAICIIPDTLQQILMSILKGLGLQKIASIICMIILYPVNITLAYILAFKLDLGVEGLWYSQTLSTIMLMLSYGVICIRTNVDTVIEESRIYLRS